MESITSEFLEQYDYYTVANKNEQFGFLLFEKGCLKMQENGNMQTALEYASIVLILHIQVQIANQQMAEKYKEAFLEDLLAAVEISSTLFLPLLKTAGIAVVTRIGADLCRDAGESAVASAVEMAGAMGALLAVLPLMQAAWEVLRSLL